MRKIKFLQFWGREFLNGDFVSKIGGVIGIEYKYNKLFIMVFCIKYMIDIFEIGNIKLGDRQFNFGEVGVYL